VYGKIIIVYQNTFLEYVVNNLDVNKELFSIIFPRT